MKYPSLILLLAFSAVSGVMAAPGIVWHEPAYAHPDLAGPTMRSPLYEVADNDITVYQGFWKNGGTNGDQNGGEVNYRFVPRGGSPGSWTSVPLGFHSNAGANQFWKAVVPTTTASATPLPLMPCALR